MEGKIKGMRACQVCGRDFPLVAEEAYVARDVEQGGLATALSSTESRWYDAIDCPHCGCQNVLQERKRPLTPGDLGDGEGYPESCADCCGGCSACPGREEADDGE